MKPRKIDDEQFDRKSIRPLKVAKRREEKVAPVEPNTEAVLLESVKGAVDELKRAVDNANAKDVTGDTLTMVARLIQSFENKPIQVDVKESEKPLLKSVTPVRDRAGVIRKYNFEWGGK